MLRAHSAAFIAPLLYLYVKSVLYRDTKITVKDLIHTLPFILVSLIFLPNFYLGDVTEKMTFYDNSNPVIEVLVVHGLMYCQLAVYLIAIFKMLFRYKRVVLDNFSTIEHIKQGWLTNFMLLYSAGFFIGLIRNIFKFTEHQQLISVLTAIMLLSTLAFVCWILLQALQNPQLFSGISSTLESVDEVVVDNNSTGKIGKVIEDEIHLNNLVRQLEQYMSAEQPFLDSSLNIDSLAKQLSIESEELSIVINRHLGKHFFDFINAYRINLATEQLSDANNKDKTILTILHDVGFNSKSSFNSEFKKQLHMTPSQYRKQYL